MEHRNGENCLMMSKRYHTIMLIAFLIPTIGISVMLVEELTDDEESTVLRGLVFALAFGTCIFGVVDHVNILRKRKYTQEIKNG